jgi:hypothetical protein
MNPELSLIVPTYNEVVASRILPLSSQDDDKQGEYSFSHNVV